jgi:hypothetical protein
MRREFSSRASREHCFNVSWQLVTPQAGGRRREVPESSEEKRKRFLVLKQTRHSYGNKELLPASCVFTAAFRTIQHD